MNQANLIVVLAGAALLLGLVSLFLFYVFIIRERSSSEDEREGAEQVNPESSQGGKGTTVSPDSKARSRSRRQTKKKWIDKSQRYLFVIFDHPGPETNRALGQLLKDVKAFYEAELGIYHIPPGHEGYPLTVANASSPGILPPLHQEGEHDPVHGVSILIKFINSRLVSNSPETLIQFTQSVAKIGGRILDFERKPVTEKTFAELRGEFSADPAETESSS
jgi:hypothetical protein